MGSYTINLSPRAADWTQEIIVPIVLPGYTVRGVAHGEIRICATLSHPYGGVTLLIDVRSENDRSLYTTRVTFTPGELIPHACERVLD